MKACLFAYLLAPAFYLVLPACGPRHAFPNEFPLGHPQVSANLVSISLWPNAIPSLHLATALLYVIFWARSYLMLGFAYLYLGLTIAATIALEHYSIDLVVGVPYAFFVAHLAFSQWRKAAINVALVLAWLLGIRFATPLLAAWPLVVPALAIATVATAVIFAGGLLTAPRCNWTITKNFKILRNSATLGQCEPRI